MPSNTPLSSITLTSSASSVIFSGIPQTYNDLILVTSTKGTSTSSHCLLTFNSDSGANYSSTFIYGTGASAMYVGRQSNVTGCFIGRASTTAFGVGTTHIQNYKSSTTYKAVLSKGNIPSEITINYIDLWRNTAPITSLTITGNGGDALVAGSTFDLYGVSTAAANNTQAFGGTDIYYDSSYVYHVFKDSGTFTPNRNLTADILVVAGGGGAGVGGAGVGGAGGGAGGLTYYSSQSVTALTNYAVVIGAGGVGGTATAASTNGTNSQFASLTASVGGGRGGHGGAYSGSASGGNGGSGGGAAYINSGNRGSIGTGTSGQGNNGGATYAADSSDGSGGGGGAGAVGATSGASNAGAGGIGTNTYSTWATVTGTGVSGYYAGGGGGSGRSGNATAAAGGTGGGGSGQVNTFGDSGTTNTGGGGGGGGTGNGSFNYSGGSGGSGIVIVRYTR